MRIFLLFLDEKITKPGEANQSITRASVIVSFFKFRHGYPCLKNGPCPSSIPKQDNA
jgi:hypothetical protein